MSRPIALISGVGRRVGIGTGIARRLAADGWDLALTYWTPYDARMPWGVHSNDIALLKDELVAMGARVIAIEADLEQSSSADEIFRSAKTEMGPVSALVLSHCGSVSSGILDISLKSFERHFAVNVRASWQLIPELAGQVPTSGGRIVAPRFSDIDREYSVDISWGQCSAVLPKIARSGEQLWPRRSGDEIAFCSAIGRSTACVDSTS